MNTDDEDKGANATNTVSFATRKRLSQEELAAAGMTQEDMDLLQVGLDTFNHDIADGGKGFVAIVFDAEGKPRITWAGSIDMIMSIGALEIAKNEFLKNVYPTNND